MCSTKCVVYFDQIFNVFRWVWRIRGITANSHFIFLQASSMLPVLQRLVAKNHILQILLQLLLCKYLEFYDQMLPLKIWKSISLIGMVVAGFFFFFRSRGTRGPIVQSLASWTSGSTRWCIHLAGSDYSWYGVILELAMEVAASWSWWLPDNGFGGVVLKLSGSQWGIAQLFWYPSSDVWFSESLH